MLHYGEKRNKNVPIQKIMERMARILLKDDLLRCKNSRLMVFKGRFPLMDVWCIPRINYGRWLWGSLRDFFVISVKLGRCPMLCDVTLSGSDRCRAVFRDWLKFYEIQHRSLFSRIILISVRAWKAQIIQPGAAPWESGSGYIITIGRWTK